MKTKNCIIIGLITVTALLTFMGCSTNNTNSADGMISNLAVRKSGEGAQALRIQSGGSGVFCSTNGTVACVGAFTGSTIITNISNGSFWFTAPAGSSSCTITDISEIPTPYVSVVRATRKNNGQSWCGTNTVTFPVLASQQYRFYIYTKNQLPPPTNGQSLALDIQWNP